MISTRAIRPIWAVAGTGAYGVFAVSGALPTVTAVDAALPTVTAVNGALSTVTARHTAVRRRQLAGPQCEQQGSSVFTAAQQSARTAAFAGKAAAHPRYVDVNDGELMRIGDVWGPDPWRPRPV